MKFSLQCVALFLVVFLAFPPAFGQQLCWLPLSLATPQMSCCAGADQAGAVSFMVADCAGGCCSVAPLSPAPLLPDRLQAASTGELPQPVVVIRLHVADEPGCPAVRGGTADLRILLQAFRI